MVPGNDGGANPWTQSSDSGWMNGIDVYYVISQTTVYTASSSYQNNSATVTVSITETWIEDRSGNRIANGEQSVSASLSNVKGYTDLQQTQIRTIAEATARAALNIGIDVGRFLGIVQGESEFGMVKTGEGAVKNALSNPSQLSSAGKGKPSRAQAAAWGSPEYAAVLQYNLEQSIIQVYQPLAKKGGSVWQLLYDWNGNTKVEKNGLQQRENFANRVTPIINGIQANKSVGPSQRAGYFEQFGRPASMPSAGVRPCITIFTCY